MYKDPLHIPSARYTVVHKGKEVLTLNKALLDRQLAWHNLDKILALHSEKLHLYDMMLETEDNDFLMLCDEYCTLIEFELQEAWGFTQDKNFHMFWQRPRCLCPKLDNNENWGTKYSIIVHDCPLHGFE